MSFQRHDYRSQAPQKYGKPTVTYPYGDTRFPRVVEVRTAKKGTDGALLLPFLTPHRDQKSYPGAVLVEQTADCGDDTDKNITETYEVLPGPIFVEVTNYKDTGIPMVVSRQKRASTDVFAEGELSVGNGLSALHILSVTAGNPCIVTLNVSGSSPEDHLLSPRMWVTIAGTGTALDGTQRILGVPAPNQLSFAVDVTGAAGAGGTATPVNHISREIKATSNAAVNVKVDSAIAAPDVTVYNENVAAWTDYAFPDSLVGRTTYEDLGVGTGAGSVWSYSFSTGAAYGLSLQHGYRGPCVARRLRCFSMGAGAGTTLESVVGSYSPTLITPTSGSAAVETVTSSAQASGSSSASSTSNTWKVGTVPPTLNSGLGGFGQVKFSVPPSAPAGFVKGDVITLLEQPQKLDAGLWQIYVKQLTCPYTMGGGGPVGTITYSANPANYNTGTTITANTPTVSTGSPNNWSCSGTGFIGIPPGLSLNPATGIITGKPTAAGTYTPTIFAADITQSNSVIITINVT